MKKTIIAAAILLSWIGIGLLAWCTLELEKRVRSASADVSVMGDEASAQIDRVRSGVSRDIERVDAEMAVALKAAVSELRSAIAEVDSAQADANAAIRLMASEMQTRREWAESQNNTRVTQLAKELEVLSETAQENRLSLELRIIAIETRLGSLGLWP